MEPAPQNPDEFEAVKKLLALKRHEEPPPGYFDRLPDEIRARIAHTQTHPEPFRRRWLEAWDLSPALATSYAAIASVLVLCGFWLANQTGPQGGQQVVTTPPIQPTTNQATLVSPSNSSPTGLFNTPSLQIQPVDFKKRAE
jgi:hypothetical protein